MKKRCCRSTPRCAACPVRAVAAARAQQAGDDVAVLLAEILHGRPCRQLPRSVTTALGDLELARSVR